MKITRERVDARHHGWTILTADCIVCDSSFTALTQRHDQPGVHHRCGTGVVGPVWTIVQPAAPAQPLTATDAA